jgi:intracellular septation protein A
MEQNNNKALWNLIINIILPVIILTKFSSEKYFGTLPAFVIALALPIGYGVYDFFKERKTNMFSIIGLVSVLLTGAIGLLELDPKWIAIKESAIPLFIGLVVIVTSLTGKPLLNKLLFNETIVNKSKIDQLLEEKKQTQAFQRAMKKANYWLAVSFFFSAVLNFILAKVIVTSPAGTEAFNKEIGRMTALSFPVIAIPSTIFLFIILMQLVKSLKSLTGLSLEEIMKSK